MCVATRILILFRQSRILPSLLVSLLSFLSYGQSVPRKDNTVDSSKPKFDSLQAVIVRPKSVRPILKVDTVEYNVSNILMRPNAVVEDLLGRLPGLQIEANGDITYNGEKIQRLLVDGQDIFGSDQTLVTRNFDASKIAKVEIIDRRTEQSNFTGIDDGTRSKTLNLVIKDTEKNGYFGKIGVGVNLKDEYSADALLAAFHEKEQFATVGLSSNIGQMGTSGNSGRVAYSNGNSDPLGASAGTGIPQFSGIATHYAKIWKSPEDHLTTNYQYSQYITNPTTNTEISQTQLNSIYNLQQQSISTNQQDQHWVYGSYDWMPNKKSALKMVLNSQYSISNNQFSASERAFFGDTVINNSQRHIKDIVNKQNFMTNIYWKTLIDGLANHILSTTINISKISNSTNGYLYSLDEFYDSTGKIKSQDTVDQRIQITSQVFNVGGALNYTRPIGKGITLGASYGVTLRMNNPLYTTFAHANGKYDEFIDSLSSNLQTTAIDQHALINVEGKIDHFGYLIGSDWLEYNYRQKDLLTELQERRRYSYITPRIILKYFGNSKVSIMLNYSGTNSLPSISQLQTVKNNSDPLHITLGNDSLRPEYDQNLRVEARLVKKWIVGCVLILGVSNNAISTKTITDTVGRQISQPVNVNGGRNAGVNLYMERAIGRVQFGLLSNNSYSRIVEFVNTNISYNDTYNYSGGISIRENVTEKYSFYSVINFAHVETISSINTAATNRYWSQTHIAGISIYFLRGFDINSNASYIWQQKTTAFSANSSVLLLNGYISRNLLSNKIVVKLSANNVLNENSGISRTNIGNTNTETSTNILGRYWMLSAIYHFDHKNRGK